MTTIWQKIKQCMKVLCIVILVSCIHPPNENGMEEDFNRAITGQDLTFTVVGQGPPLLLIHGFGANSYTWTKLLEHLAVRYTVISLDLKGHGHSPKPLNEQYSLHDQANLIMEFIHAKGLQNLTLVGHSLGGAIALLSAIKLKQQGSDAVRALVLIDTIAYRQSLPRFIKLMRVPLLGSLLVHTLPEKFQAKMILNLVYHDSERITEEAIQAYSVPLKSQAAKEALLSTARSILPPDIDEITSQYSMLDAPTLLLWGDHDKVVPYVVQERLARALTNAKLVKIFNTGHAPQEETPLAVLAEMSSFLCSVYSNSDWTNGIAP